MAYMHVLKVIFSFLFIFAHLFSTVGLNMHIHECSSEKSYLIYGVSLNETCTCDHNSPDHDDDCCSDKQVQVKADDQDKITSKVGYLFHIIDAGPASLPLSFNIPQQLFTNTTSFAPGTDYPPEHGPPLYLLHSRLII